MKSNSAAGGLRLLLFSAVVNESMVATAVDMPGWSHAGPRCAEQPSQRVVFFFAENRRKAARDLGQHCGSARDLDAGRRCDGLIAACHRRAFPRASITPRRSLHVH